MSLNNRLCAELIRQRLNLPDDSQAARIINAIPASLKEFGRTYAADPFTRPLVTTAKATTTIPIGARGQVNLVTGYDTYQFLLEYLDKGQMYFLPSVTANPYILSGGTYASGYWTFNANPQHDETIAINGVTFTFKQPNALVAGSGRSDANESCGYNGVADGKPKYLAPISTDFIIFDQDTWYIKDDGSALLYSAESDADYPWDVETWEVSVEGVLPLPTVTKDVSMLTSVQVEIGETLSDTIANFITTLNASVNASITVATYTAGEARGRVIGTYDTQGTGGNSFTLANSSLASVTRSGATFTGGASTAYALAISSFTTYFDELSRVQFTTTVTLPTGISASTNYYLTDYTIDGDTATFGLSSTADGLTPVTISSAGSGVLTMASQDSETDIPLQLVSPQQAPLTQYLGDVFSFAYVQGNLLNLLPIGDTYPTGSVAFAVAFYPTNLSALPESAECEALFLQILSNMCAVPVMPVV